MLVCGDAAGLLEPWTREGISYALRSGRLAGEWDALPEEEKQAHIRVMHHLVLDPPLSQIITENRR